MIDKKNKNIKLKKKDLTGEIFKKAAIFFSKF